MPKRYDVDNCADDLKELRTTLTRIARENGRVMTVLWQPRRNTAVKAGRLIEEPAGYVVVSEYD
jgi:hypothetical protein